jgi:hypothetical protein
LGITQMYFGKIYKGIAWFELADFGAGRGIDTGSGGDAAGEVIQNAVTNCREENRYHVLVPRRTPYPPRTPRMSYRMSVPLFPYCRSWILTERLISMILNHVTLGA